MDALDSLLAEEAELLDRTLSLEELEDAQEAPSKSAEVTFSTQDYPVDGLVKRIRSGAMIVPQFGSRDPRVQTAGFQRGFVWTKAQMDKFIESLLMGYPIPGIFLVKQAEDNRLLVLDGQQRLETLRRFYDGIHNDRRFTLENVGTDFSGLTYETLPEDLRIKLDDSYMQATIVAADGSSAVDDAIYQIFERLNSGGTQLTSHEIRVALYAGDFITSVEALNDSPGWRTLYGAKSKRLRDHELITRILALYANAQNYSRPLKGFLNGFVQDHRTEQPYQQRTGELFRLAADTLSEESGPNAFRRPGGSQVNAAQAEAIMVALMRMHASGVAPESLGSKISELIIDKEFVLATSRATADKDTVETRLRRAYILLSDGQE